MVACTPITGWDRGRILTGRSRKGWDVGQVSNQWCHPPILPFQATHATRAAQHNQWHMVVGTDLLRVASFHALHSLRVCREWFESFAQVSDGGHLDEWKVI
jgi:hypothetical protein